MSNHSSNLPLSSMSLRAPFGRANVNEQGKLKPSPLMLSLPPTGSSSIALPSSQLIHERLRCTSKSVMAMALIVTKSTAPSRVQYDGGGVNKQGKSAPPPLLSNSKPKGSSSIASPSNQIIHGRSRSRQKLVMGMAFIVSNSTAPLCGQ